MPKQVRRAAEAAVENRARQVALTAALSFATYVLFTQFVRTFFG